MRSIKVSDYFKLVKPNYIFVKLKPNNSIRNQSTHNLARAISSLYKNLFQCIQKEEEKVVSVIGKDFIIPSKLNFQVQGKIAYYIYIEKKKIEFYFIIPKHFYSIIEEKISDVWSNITIEEVKEIPRFSEKSLKYQMVYEKEDALSLNSDRKSNDLLNSNLNVVDVMEQNDKVGILYNFMPTTQESMRNKYKHTIERVKKGIPVERNKVGFSYIFKVTLNFVDTIVQDISDVLSGGNNKKHEESILESIVERLNGGVRISPPTERKGKGLFLPTQILVVSESQDKIRQKNNAWSLAQSFDVVSADNKLIPKKLNKKVNLTNYNLGAEINNIGDEEAQNFISIAGRELLERYNFIDKVETQETQIPEDLRSGVMCIGTNTYRGHKQKAYLTNDEQFRNLLTLMIGPTRAGKSNLISNLSIDAIENDECVIIFDFIENCELSEEVSSLFPDKQVLNIDCGKFDNLQGLGYNEVGISDDVMQRYENAKRQTSNLLALVNSVNSGGDISRLTPKMERYLESAALVTFINSGSIKDVFSVLQNYNKRHQFIKKVPVNQNENMEEYIGYLYELDDKNKSGEETGETRTGSIVGIIDRLNTLKRNTYMERMLKTDISNNVNLVEEMQKNQVICIKIPQSAYPTDGEKDICTTYWISKIWLALQVRADKIRDKKKRKKVNLVIDELYQVESTEKFLTSKLSQIAKFIMKPIVSCHYINQLKHMRDELRAANTSYMLIAGCDEQNYKELKTQLYPFTEEDLLNLPRYHSMNYVKCKNGYSRFITKLPGKVEDRIKERMKQKEVNLNEITFNGKAIGEVAVTTEPR